MKIDNIEEKVITVIMAAGKGTRMKSDKSKLVQKIYDKELVKRVTDVAKKIGSDEVLEFEVSGDKIEAVHMLPGYTHNIINLSDTEDLVTVMWANEQFDPQKPDTYFEPVK